MRAAILTAALLLVLAPAGSCARVRSNPDSVQLAQECARAARVVERGGPPVHEERAWSTIVMCAAREPGAVARAWAAQRSVSDTSLLSSVFARLWTIRDSALFATALAAADDEGATPAMRVYSLMLLLAQVDVHQYPLFDDFRAPMGEDDICRFTLVSGRDVHEGTPLPNDARETLRSLASRQAAAGSHAWVRSAGRCVQQALIIEDMARQLPRREEP